MTTNNLDKPAPTTPITYMNLDFYRMQKIYVEIYRWVGRVYEYFGCESNIVGEPAPTGITIDIF